MTADTPMTEGEGLLACPFCGATPHRGLSPKIYDNSGEFFQRYRLWCPHGCARTEQMTETSAIAAWNRRLSAPAPGVREKIARIIDPEGWEQADAAKGINTGVQRMWSEDSLAKADAILASLPAQGGETIEQAYRRGWNDRESDLLVGADRVAPPVPEQEAG